MKRLLPLLLAAGLGGCVTIAEPTLSPASVEPGQRTILLVYPAPGTWVVSESESKAEAAALSMPLLSTMAQALQDERDRKMSEKLSPYIPPWRPEREFEPLLRSELAKSGFPGRVVPADQSELDAKARYDFNRAANILDWQRVYFYGDPSKPLPRNYSQFLSLDDALVFETNLLTSVAADENGNMIPTLSASSRLVRCQTNRLLWKHEDKADDPAGARSLNEFATLPQQLIDRWKALIPALAAKVVESLRVALGQTPPAPAAPPPAPSGQPLPPGYPQPGQAMVPTMPPPGYPQPAAPVPTTATQSIPWSMPAIGTSTTAAAGADGPAATPPTSDGPPATPDQ